MNAKCQKMLFAIFYIATESGKPALYSCYCGIAMLIWKVVFLKGKKTKFI